MSYESRISGTGVQSCAYCAQPLTGDHADDCEWQNRMNRIGLNAAKDYIEMLVDFIRECSEATSSRTKQAAALVCMEKGCYNRPGNWTPDGSGFCGQHAHVMD